MGLFGSAAEVSRVLTTAAPHRQLDSFHVFIRDRNGVQKRNFEAANQRAAGGSPSPPPAAEYNLPTMPLRAAEPAEMEGRASRPAGSRLVLAQKKYDT